MPARIILFPDPLSGIGDTQTDNSLRHWRCLNSAKQHQPEPLALPSSRSLLSLPWDDPRYSFDHTLRACSSRLDEGSYLSAS